MEIGGTYSDIPPVVCVFGGFFKDPAAKALITELVYPPYLQVRDQILPSSSAGAVVRKHFYDSYEELVSIMQEDPDLVRDVLDVMIECLPFVRALAGERVSSVPLDGHTPSTYTASRVRPGMLDELERLADRFEASGSEALVTRLQLYRGFFRQCEGLEPIDVLTAIRGLET
jgi:hypothetical protein